MTAQLISLADYRKKHTVPKLATYCGVSVPSHWLHDLTLLQQVKHTLSQQQGEGVEMPCDCEDR